MKTFLVRLGVGFTLACLVSGLAGCAGQPMHAKSAPSYATFKITFQPDPPARPTSMVITPDDGNVVLQVVKAPGPDDNKVVWQSDQKFSVRFGQICDKTQPLPPGQEFGDERNGWNEAKLNHGVWKYTLNLRQGSGRGKETVEGRYSIKHVDSDTDFDPVIIVGR
jgi:hypothetical protein